MLVGFLQSLNFCQLVEPSVLENTNLQTTPSHSTADLLFFPGLVQSKRPDSLVQQGALEFGWCLGCVDPEQYFSSRFLHILLLSVAYRFSVYPTQGYFIILWSPAKVHCLEEWHLLDNITTLIELLDNNRRVLVAMSCSKDRPMEHAELLAHSLVFFTKSTARVWKCTSVSSPPAWSNSIPSMLYPTLTSLTSRT